MKIGLFGGTFNPIHNGHLALASRLLQAAKLDEVWLLVTPQNPWKANMELLDDLVELDEGNGYAISRVVGRILDKEQKQKLYDHLRVDGVVQISKVVDCMKEIFDKLGNAGKN